MQYAAAPTKRNASGLPIRSLVFYISDITISDRHYMSTLSAMVAETVLYRDAYSGQTLHIVHKLWLLCSHNYHVVTKM